MANGESEIVKVRDEIRGGEVAQAAPMQGAPIWPNRPETRFYRKTASGRFVTADPLVLSAHTLRRESEAFGLSGGVAVPSEGNGAPAGTAAPALERSGNHDEGMERVMDYLREHFREDVPMKVLADLVRLSLRQFHRNFKKRFGIPPNQFLIRMRVSAAQNMLLSDNRPISEIAYTLGFADDTLFIRQFKARMGMTPLQYRKSKR